MKNIFITIIAVLYFVAACGSSHSGSSSTAPSASPEATATTDQSSASTNTDTSGSKTTSNTTRSKPNITLRGIGNGTALSLAADSAVDSLIFETASATLYMYRPNQSIKTPTSGNATDWSYINIGLTEASSQSCKDMPLLTKGSKFDFCETVSSSSIDDTFAEQVGDFSVDFMVMSMSGIGFTSNGAAYLSSNAGAFSNDAINNLPYVMVAYGSESAITTVFARNDIFPNAFALSKSLFDDINNPTGDKAAAPVHTEIQIVDSKTIQIQGMLFHSSIDLTSQQEAIVFSFLKEIGASASAIDFVPTAPSTLDVKTGHIASDNPPPAATNSTAAPVSSSTKLVGSVAIPFNSSQFTININLDQVLSDDSNLSANPPTFGIKKVNGIPFGTEMTVTSK